MESVNLGQILDMAVGVELGTYAFKKNLNLFISAGHIKPYHLLVAEDWVNSKYVHILVKSNLTDYWCVHAFPKGIQDLNCTQHLYKNMG